MAHGIRDLFEICSCFSADGRLSTGRTWAAGSLTSMLEDLVDTRNRDLKSRRDAFKSFAAMVSFDDGLVSLS